MPFVLGSSTMLAGKMEKGNQSLGDCPQLLTYLTCRCDFVRPCNKLILCRLSVAV